MFPPHLPETVPPLLEKYQKEVEQISKDIPILQEVVKETWKKEDQLKQLKSDLVALDRKIQLSLKPVKQNEDSTARTRTKPRTKVTASPRYREHLRQRPPHPTASPTSTSRPTSFPPLQKRSPRT